MVGRQFGAFHFIDRHGQKSEYHPRWIHWGDRPGRMPHVVLLAVKWPALPAVRIWLERWGRQALVVSLLNGMGQETALVPPLDPLQLSVASTTDAVSRQDAPNRQTWATTVTHHGQTFLTETAHPYEERLKSRAQALNLDWVWENPATMHQRRWSKLIANSVINPLSALAARSNGEILTMPLWRLASPLVQEAEAVAQHAGIAISHSLPDIEQLARATQHNRSSMLQDVMDGIPTELDAITGYILTQAQHRGLPVPTHRAVYDLMKHLNSPG